MEPVTLAFSVHVGVCVWICFTCIYVRAYIHTHIYFFLKKNPWKLVLQTWKLLQARVFNNVPHCKNKHIKHEEFPNAIAVCPSSCISTVLCLSVVLAWKESVTSHSVGKHSSLYPLSLVLLRGWDLISSWLPFLFLFFPDGLDLFRGMLLGWLVQGLTLYARQPLFLFNDFLPHLVVLQEVLSYLAVDFPPFESFLSWENTKLLICVLSTWWLFFFHIINRN